MSQERELPDWVANDRGGGLVTHQSKRRLNVSMLLDCSGSMEACRPIVLNAVNRYLCELQTAEVKSDTRLSLTLFNSLAIEAVRDRVPAGACPDLRDVEYRPSGSTPLLDAVGYAAALLDCLSESDEQRVLVIVTDGLENASRQFSHDSICNMIEHKRRVQDWLVLYLGADHDSQAQGNRIGIPSRWIADVSRGRLVKAAGIIAAIGQRYRSAEPAERACIGFREAERVEIGRAA